MQSSLLTEEQVLRKEITDRFRALSQEIMEQRGLSIAKFMGAIGSTSQKWTDMGNENRNVAVGIEMLSKAEEVFGINPRYVISGKGEAVIEMQNNNNAENIYQNQASHSTKFKQVGQVNKTQNQASAEVEMLRKQMELMENQMKSYERMMAMVLQKKE